VRPPAIAAAASPSISWPSSQWTWTTCLSWAACRPHDAQFGVGEEDLDPADPGVPECLQVGRDHMVRPVEHRVQPDIHRGPGGGEFLPAAQQARDRSLAGPRVGERQDGGRAAEGRRPGRRGHVRHDVGVRVHPSRQHEASGGIEPFGRGGRDVGIGQRDDGAVPDQDVSLPGSVRRHHRAAGDRQRAC
jgi:hypothetical protein